MKKSQGINVSHTLVSNLACSYMSATSSIVSSPPRITLYGGFWRDLRCSLTDCFFLRLYLKSIVHKRSSDSLWMALKENDIYKSLSQQGKTNNIIKVMLKLTQVRLQSAYWRSKIQYKIVQRKHFTNQAQSFYPWLSFGTCSFWYIDLLEKNGPNTIRLKYSYM